MKARSARRTRASALLLGSVVLSAAASSCSPTTSGPQALAIMPGIINRTDNKSLRTAMLKYGLEQFCQEMTHRGAPLSLTGEPPTIGRFFAQRCDTRFFDDDVNKSFLVQFFGYGYAWTNGTQRFGFESAGVVEYDPDFLLDGSTMYVYFRTKHLGASSFQTSMVEGALANVALAVAPQGLANQIGQQIVSGELTRGFTVIRDADGSVDFGVGIVEKGKRPFHPFQVTGSDKVVLANERTEVHSSQRDFLGPFLVDGDGRALYLTMSIDGADAVDVMVFPKDAADPWLAEYARKPQASPPPYPPLMQDVVTSRMEWRKTLPVAKGYYYVVVDNTATAGRVAPPPATMGDRAALVSYVVQVGEH